MHKYLILALFFAFGVSYAQQDYFKGEYDLCTPTNKEAYDRYQHARLALKYTKPDDTLYMRKLSEVFYQVYKADTVFCDALYFTGYTLRCLNEPDAALYFFAKADSVAEGRSLLYKQDMAATAMRVGHPELAKQKYEEMIQYFDESPEAHYGMASLSLMTGDFKVGVNHINNAIRRTKAMKLEVKDDILFMKATLLALDNKPAEALPLFEDAEDTYGETDLFRIYYAMALLRNYFETNDERSKKKAERHYRKIADKSLIPEDARVELSILEK